MSKNIEHDAQLVSRRYVLLRCVAPTLIISVMVWMSCIASSPAGATSLTPPSQEYVQEFDKEKSIASLQADKNAIDWRAVMRKRMRKCMQTGMCG